MNHPALKQLFFTLLCAFSVGMVGCAGRPPAASVRSTVLPSGAQGYSVSCQNAQSINACYELAGDVCTAGYDIIHTQESTGMSGSAAQVGDVASAAVSTNWQRGLLIECKQNAQIQKRQHADRARALQEQQLQAAADRTAAQIFGGGFVVLIAILVVVSL